MNIYEHQHHHRPIFSFSRRSLNCLVTLELCVNIFFVGSVVRSDCTGDLSTTCRSCSPGTFMREPNGLHRCFTCKHCAESMFIYFMCFSFTFRICNFALLPMWMCCQMCSFRSRSLHPEEMHYNRKHHLWCAWWILLHWLLQFTVPLCWKTPSLQARTRNKNTWYVSQFSSLLVYNIVFPHFKV